MPSRKRAASDAAAPGDAAGPGPSKLASPATRKRKPTTAAKAAFRTAKRQARAADDVPLDERDDALLFVRDVAPAPIAPSLAYEVATDDTDVDPAALSHAVGPSRGASTEVDSDAVVAAQLGGRRLESIDGESIEDGELGDEGVDDASDEIDAAFDDSKLPSRAELEILASVEAASDLMGAKNAGGRRYWVEPDMAHTCTLCGEQGHSRKACKHTQVRHRCAIRPLIAPVLDVRRDGRSRHAVLHDLDHVLRLRPARSHQPGPCASTCIRAHRRQNCQTPRRDTGICELCPGFKHSRTSCARQWRQYTLLSAAERPIRPPGQALVRGCYNCGDNTHFGCAVPMYDRSS